MKKVMTLCLVYKNNQLLLGMKKRGFGEGRWNGFGGKVLDGESIEEATKREIFEEAGIMVKEPNKIGVIEFEFKDSPEILEVHIFKAQNFKGIPKESEEMLSKWFDIQEIPFSQMWPDDKYWLPLFLADKKFKGEFLFDETINILDYNLLEVEELN